VTWRGGTRARIVADISRGGTNAAVWRHGRRSVADITPGAVRDGKRPVPARVAAYDLSG